MNLPVSQAHTHKHKKRETSVTTCDPPGQPDWLLEKQAAAAATAAVVMLTLTASAVALAAVPWTLIAAMAVVPLAAQLQQQQKEKESASLVSEALLVQLQSLVQSLCQPLTAKESALLSAPLVSCDAILISLQQCLPLSP